MFLTILLLSIELFGIIKKESKIAADLHLERNSKEGRCSIVGVLLVRDEEFLRLRVEG